MISGVERRRRWSHEQKQAVVAASFAPGSSVAEIAREADVRTSQIYRWRRQLALPDADAASGFASVMVRPDPSPSSSPAMIIEIGGAVVRVNSSAPAALMTAALRALR